MNETKVLRADEFILSLKETERMFFSEQEWRFIYGVMIEHTRLHCEAMLSEITSGEEKVLLVRDIEKDGNNYIAKISGELPERWKPCGEGENICNCKNASECGYIEFYAGIARLDGEGNFR